MVVEGRRVSALYRVQKFAKLAGVTVRALHHYDRLGLLKPQRTEAGYRLYALRDLERLEQIVALKFLGLPLKQIKLLLDRDPLQLPDALRLQRTVLEDKRRLLDRAINAIRNAEKIVGKQEPGRRQTAVLKKIIEVIGMQDNLEVMKKYYTDEAWTKWAQRYYQSPPSQAWMDLFGEVTAALGEDPAGETAQALATRWLQLVDSETGGDPDVKAGLIKAWADREHWPAAMRMKASKFDIERIAEFIGKAITSGRKKYYSEESWAKWTERPQQSREQASAEWVELVREVRASLGEDPAGEKAQALAARWIEVAESMAGNDSGILTAWTKAWEDRQHWPARERQQLASSDYEKVAEFVGKAIGCAMKKYYSEEAWAKVTERREQSTQESREQASRAWVDFYRDASAALGENPAGGRAQALVTRWTELMETSAGGDAEIKAALMRAWADLPHWPVAGRKQITSKQPASFNLERVWEFINQARARRKA
jgi:DNA-binding transcriptional MerR regulator